MTKFDTYENILNFQLGQRFCIVTMSWFIYLFLKVNVCLGPLCVLYQNPSFIQLCFADLLLSLDGEVYVVKKRSKAEEASILQELTFSCDSLPAPTCKRENQLQYLVVECFGGSTTLLTRYHMCVFLCVSRGCLRDLLKK